MAGSGRSEAAADGIVYVETSTADGKIGAVLGRRVALAIDAGINGAEGRRLAEALAELGHATDRLVYTHGHVDHVLGSEQWIGGEVYAQYEAAAHIERQVPSWAERYERPADELVASLAWPTVRFGDELDLDIGGRDVRLVPTPGHAPGAVCVFVPDRGVLFGGDMIVTGIPPSFKDGDNIAFEASLRRLADLNAATLVPGHGSIVRGQAEVRAAILWLADYLARCREHVAARIGVVPVETIVSEARFDEFIGGYLDRDRNRMLWRHEQTILTMAAQLEQTSGGMAEG
jgi:cyclase